MLLLLSSNLLTSILAMLFNRLSSIFMYLSILVSITHSPPLLSYRFKYLFSNVRFVNVRTLAPLLKWIPVKACIVTRPPLVILVVNKILWLVNEIH